MRAQVAVAEDTDFPYGHNMPSGMDGRFAQFHLENPDVYKTLARLARQARQSGKTKCSIKMLFEVARWEWYLQTTASDGYKLNNNFTSRYARLLMQQEADLAGFFDLRSLQT